jgi:hypothetical protein
MYFMVSAYPCEGAIIFLGQRINWADLRIPIIQLPRTLTFRASSFIFAEGKEFIDPLALLNKIV